MSTRTHIKAAVAPKQGCCGDDHAPQPKTEKASERTGQRDRHHILDKSSAGSGSCCCGGNSSDNRSVEPQISPAKAK